MSDFINTIDELGDEVVMSSVIDRSITEFKDDVLTSIGAYAFNSCSALTSVDLPLVTSIHKNCFQLCTNLVSINMTNLVKMSGNYCFSMCSALENVDMPNLISSSTFSFAQCGSLTEVIFPSMTTVGASTFNRCGALISVDLPVATSIGAGAFGGCYNLIVLILRSELLCELSNVNAFTQNVEAATGIYNGTGYIYVPSALIEDYKVATNWADLYGTNPNVFRALEDYTVDGTITGELDESKI